jgi:hypothetical protein
MKSTDDSHGAGLAKDWVNSAEGLNGPWISLFCLFG